MIKQFGTRKTQHRDRLLHIRLLVLSPGNRARFHFIFETINRHHAIQMPDVSLFVWEGHCLRNLVHAFQSIEFEQHV